MARRSAVFALAALASLSLTACEQKKEEAAPPPENLPPIVKEAPAALTADGPAETLKPGDAEEGLQAAASVVELTYLQKQDDLTVKLFGTAGGDPAMNGLYTYLAFYLSPADGWRIFKLGDFLDYRVLAETPGRLDLELHTSVLDEASGEISDAHRRVIVQWKVGAEGAPPQTLSVTPAK